MKNRNSWLICLAICLGLVMCAIGIPIASAEKTVVYNEEPQYTRYDIDMDGDVDDTDVQMLQDALGLTGALGWIREDINKDGTVDILDVSGLVNHYGEVYDPYAGITKSIYITNETIYINYDINMDGKVDEADSQLLQAAYGQTGTPGWIREDINQNGKVDAFDVSGLLNHYGEVYDPYFGIQKAIDFANDGDTIYVASGIYTENVVINKQVTIIGNGTDTTILDGNKQDAIHLEADGAQISGIAVTNGDYGLKVTGSGNKIHQNKFYNNRENVEDYGANTYTLNYFDDYNGYDADDDGIGDTPHYIYKDNKDAQVTGRFNELPDAPSTVKIQDCDINLDCKITGEDLSAVIKQYKQDAKGTPGWIKEDVVKDGVVDIIDVCAVKKYMSQTYDNGHVKDANPGNGNKATIKEDNTDSNNTKVKDNNSKNNSKFNNINNTIVQRWQNIYDMLSKRLPQHNLLLRMLLRMITHWQAMNITG